MSVFRRSPLLLAASAAAIALSVTLAFADPPTTYNANTTLNYYNNASKGQGYPALPNWGGASGAINTTINDPSFGTPIIRVSNSATSIHTRACTVPDSAEARNWNTNSTLFWIHDVGGGRTIGFNLNTTTGQVSQIAATLPSLNDFDATSANLCWGQSGTKLIQYNFTNATSTTIVDVQTLTAYPLNGRLSGDMRTSRNGVSGIICGGTVQNTDFLAVSYNASTGEHHILDASLHTIDGVSYPAGNTASKFHNCTIAPGGRYICLAPGDGSGILAIWDVTGGTVYPITTQTGGHRVFGYGPDQNSALINEGTNLAKTNETWIIRKLPQSQINTYNDLCEHPATDPQRWDAAPAYDNHDSWNNSRSNASYPVFTDNYHAANASNTDPGLVWGDEIVAIGTGLSSGNTVYRFAQHRSQQNLYSGAIDFYDTPRGTISQDGLWFMFASNYGNTLGTNPDNNNHYRTDVFVLKLTPGA